MSSAGTIEDSGTEPTNIRLEGCEMDDLKVSRERLDLHNSNIDFHAALAGQCGFTHLDTGRVCRLPHRHPGPCQLQG